MPESHMQSRGLTDALCLVDNILAGRGTSLAYSAARAALARWFAPQPHPVFFDGWAFMADGYAEAMARIRACAPGLAQQVVPPSNPNDFTIVTHCALDLRFAAVPEGNLVKLMLANGTQASGAEVPCERGIVYSNGMVALPAADGNWVCFHQPGEDFADGAAAAATRALAGRGQAAHVGLDFSFPVARTSTLPDYEWVRSLQSRCATYVVRAFHSQGEARVDQHGFFARETQVVQMGYLSMREPLRKIVFDGPFLAFFAAAGGVHVAAWFDWDAFQAVAATGDGPEAAQCR